MCAFFAQIKFTMHTPETTDFMYLPFRDTLRNPKNYCILTVLSKHIAKQPEVNLTISCQAP